MVVFVEWPGLNPESTRGSCDRMAADVNNQLLNIKTLQQLRKPSW